jgi:hypothetical protein
MPNRNTIFSVLTAAFMHLNCIARAAETPLPLHLYPQDQQVKKGEVVTWYLTAAGTEPLEYQWKVNGKEIPGGNTNVLRIASANPSDQGLYTCTIKNEAGATVTQTVALTVKPDSEITTAQKIKTQKAPANATALSPTQSQP